MPLIEFPQRLDAYLTLSALSPSREIAKKLIQSCCVLVDKRVVTKPSFQVTPDMTVEVLDNDITHYVSRGAYKLKGALDAFGIDVTGATAVDFGASTGGFTDLLLERGAALVFAIENGSNQLHPKLREDNRVISFDNTNARYIDRGFIPLCDVAVMDVSFISQTKLYGSVTNVLKPQGKFISLIKPQFEAGRDAIGKNGIVKDKSLYPSIIANIKETAKAFDLILLSTIESPILGGDGNTEFLAYFIYSPKE